MEEFLISLISDHAAWAYFIIILISAAEGPILSIILGVLIKLNYFSFWPVYAAVMVGDVIADTLLYYMGYKYGDGAVKKFGKYVSLNESSIEKAKEIFHKHKHPILIISKMTNGFGLSFAVLMTAGISRIPFWKFFFSNLVGQFFWSAALIGVGYYFSHMYLQINNAMGKVFFATGIILVVTLSVGFIKYLKRRSNI